MSKANKLGKELARERAALLRAEQARRARRKRMYTVYGSVLGVLVIAVVVALVVQNATAPKTPTLVPTASVGDTTGGISAADGMAIPIGNSSAKVKLTVYEDARCSACKAYESTFTPAYKKLVQDGTLELLIHPVTLIDSVQGGSGSLHAGNAFACAQDAGKFEDYHDIIYNNQPAETTDSFSSDTTLITLAKQVPNLDGKAFETCVNSHKYFDWVRKNYADLNKMSDNKPSTPTIYANGSPFTLPNTTNTTQAQQQFTASIEKLAGPAASGSPSAGGSPSPTQTGAPASPTPSASSS
jgi:protein-disulfide isomerase